MLTLEKPKVLPLTAMARRLNVPTAWLRDEAEARRVPSVPVGGGKFLFAPEAVETRLAQRASQE